MVASKSDQHCSPWESDLRHGVGDSPRWMFPPQWQSWDSQELALKFGAFSVARWSGWLMRGDGGEGGRAWYPGWKKEINHLTGEDCVIERLWSYSGGYFHIKKVWKQPMFFISTWSTVLHTVCLLYRSRLDLTSPLDCGVHNIYCTWGEAKAKPKPNTGI